MRSTRRSGHAIIGALAAMVMALGASSGSAAQGATAPPAAATAGGPASTVIYRCTASNGAVALQDDPCPAGQRQETREIAAFAAPTLSVASASSMAPESSAADQAASAPTSDASNDDAARSTEPPTITVLDAPVGAPPSFLPPPLWRCTDLNGRSRLSEVYDPQPRCVPLSVLGVDLSRAPPSAANLCRTVEDECVELGGDAACAAWQERFEGAESALRHAFSDDAPARRAERDRARAIVENDCRP